MMKIMLLAVFTVFTAILTAGEKYMMETKQDKTGKTFSFIQNDPFNTRIYTLKNGLTLYLSRNPAKPVSSVITAVRAGSTDEPASSTGLAHYFEHMMFKGTDKLGTLDWKKEKALLDKIEDLFEQRRAAKTVAEKNEIYKEIDKLSGRASKFASAGEFAKLSSHIGTDNQNAATGSDYTVYLGEVPANELEKYLILEAERFKKPVMRLFHTELETVYEEFNRAQDKDSSVAHWAMMRELLPIHPGGRSIIGNPEHLKYPSMRDIYSFFQKYYVPENMALIIAGDIDYEKTVAMAENTMGQLPRGIRPKRLVPMEKPLTENRSVTISGPEAESVRVGYRVKRNPENAMLTSLLVRMLSDNGYGLVDQNLQRAQKLLKVAVYPIMGREYIVLCLSATPRKGQTLAEAEKLLKDEIEKIRLGKYEDWRIGAVAENCRVAISDMSSGEDSSIVWEFVEMFVNDEKFSDVLNLPDRMAAVSKERLSRFLDENFKYSVTVRKTVGTPEKRVKVSKPKITPVELNSGRESEFAKKFLALPSVERTVPEKLNFKTDILSRKLDSGITVRYINRKLNSPLFEMTRMSDAGKLRGPKFEFAAGYMNFVGTDRYSPDALRQEFYKLGARFNFSTEKYGSVLSVDGPDRNLEKVAALVEHFLNNAKGDKKSLKKYIDGILRQRMNDKLNPGTAFYRGVAYAWYGPKNIQTDLLSEAEMRAMSPEDVVGIIRTLYTGARTNLVYSGPSPAEKIVNLAKNMKSENKPAPGRGKVYTPKEVVTPNVYLIDYDIVQYQSGFVSRGPEFSPDRLSEPELFNEYFCSGLDSIVFQEIRESRALAYSAGGAYISPMEKKRYDVIFMAIGTQPDKFPEAAKALSSILRKMPVYEKKFLGAKEALLKKLEAARTFGTQVYSFQRKLERMGLKEDYRPGEYAKLRNLSSGDLNAFFNRHLAKLNYDIVVIGKIQDADIRKFEKLGKVIRLSPKDIFGY